MVEILDFPVFHMRVLDFPGRLRPDRRVIDGVWQPYNTGVVALKNSMRGKTLRTSPVWRANAGRDEIKKFWSTLDFQSAGVREAIQAPKMVTARFSRSVSQPHLDLSREFFLCLPRCLDLFDQSVARSNYLAALVARWSLVSHFFSCLDRHHCSTQGWFCATIPPYLLCFHWNRCPVLSFEFKQHGIANSSPTINHRLISIRILK